MYNLISFYYDLKQTEVLRNVKKIYENETSTALVIVITESRFFSEFVTINRLSKFNYHINCGKYHCYTRTAKQAVKIVKEIINKKYFNLEE